MRLIQALVRAGNDVEVHVVQRTSDTRRQEQLRDALPGVAVHDWARHGPLTSRRIAYLRRWPIVSGSTFRPEVLQRVHAVAASGGAIVLDHSSSLCYWQPGMRAVLSSHNIESARFAESVAGPRWRSLERRRDAARFRALEGKAFASPQTLTVLVSEAERAQAGAGSVVVPNGADLPAAVAADGPRDIEVLFVGAMDYEANSDAVIFWCEEIWPLLQTRGTRLTVVGRSPESLPIRYRQHPGIDLVGEVDEVSTFLSRAQVFAAPLRRGAGTRLKILECMAYGLPWVATTKAVEGLPVQNEVEGFVGDDAPGIASGIVRLLDDPDSRLSMGRSGRALSTSFDWTGIADRFASHVENHFHAVQ